MYQFTEDCLIGIKEIDEEHKHLFELINQAIELAAQSKEVKIVTKNLIRELKDYATYHFTHEEQYMEAIKDPELALQKKAHALFIKKVNDFPIEDTIVREDLDDLLHFLVRWLYHHILSNDMMIGKSITSTIEDPFAFTENYWTGIAMIDEEHKHLFEIISQANDAVHVELVHDKYDKIMEILSELAEYTKEHFHDEEEYMQSIHYDQLEAQKRAHSVFIDKVVNIDLDELDTIDANQQEYLEELIAFLLDWLVNHILKMDKRIGQN